jgi:hypothetical protein
MNETEVTRAGLQGWEFLERQKYPIFVTIEENYGLVMGEW